VNALNQRKVAVTVVDRWITWRETVLTRKMRKGVRTTTEAVVVAVGDSVAKGIKDAIDAMAKVTLHENAKEVAEIPAGSGEASEVTGAVMNADPLIIWPEIAILLETEDKSLNVANVWSLDIWLVIVLCQHQNWQLILLVILAARRATSPETALILHAVIEHTISILFYTNPSLTTGVESKVWRDVVALIVFFTLIQINSTKYKTRVKNVVIEADEKNCSKKLVAANTQYNMFLCFPMRNCIQMILDNKTAPVELFYCTNKLNHRPTIEHLIENKKNLYAMIADTLAKRS